MSGTWIENDPTAVDYLGREAPIALADRAALPTGEAFTLATAPPTASGGGTTPAPAGPGAISGPSGAPSQAALSRFLSMVTGGPAPLPEGQKPGGAIETGSAGAVMTAAPSDGTDAALAASGSGGLLDQILAAGGTTEKAIDALMELLTQRPDSILNPGEFSLSGEGGGDVMASGDFSLDAGNLNAVLPQLLQLRGLFDETGAPLLDPASFNFQGAEGAPVLNPSDFDLGDTTLFQGGQTPDFLTRASDTASAALPYAGALLKLAPLLANPSGDRIGAFLGELSTSPQAAQFAAQALGSSGVPAAWAATNAATLADLGLAAGSAGSGLASAGAGAIMAMFAPGALGGERSPIVGEPAARVLKRIARTRDAGALQNQILEPLFAARTGEEFVSALEKPVGGSTVGDALTAMIWNNLTGTWYADTGHAWLPDLELLPLLTVLQNLGYSGQTEPTRGDVGGVGEIVKAGIPFLPPDPSYPGSTMVAGGGGEDMIATPDYAGGSRGASVGWDRLLREATEAVTGEPITAPAPFDIASGYGASYAPTYMIAAGSGGEDQNAGYYNVPPPNVSPEYLAQLEAFSPEAADKVRAHMNWLDDAQSAALSGFSAGGG